jgi:predicted AlkP superfamily pyrophosphatase or phosphodiesterase
MSIGVQFSAIVLFVCLLSSTFTNAAPPLLLVISFDGFRWDYPDLYHLPNFNSILQRGVRVKYIENTFKMYDRQLNQSVDLAEAKDGRWW